MDGPTNRNPHRRNFPTGRTLKYGLTRSFDYVQKNTMKALNSIELFSGAGGLALGLHAAGFRHRALYEWNRSAIETLLFNQSRKHKALKAGDHGVPGGENMILYPDGSIRYLTTRPTPQLGELRNFEFSGTLPPSQPICLARKRIPPNQNGRSAMTRHRFRPGRSVCASYREILDGPDLKRWNQPSTHEHRRHRIPPGIRRILRRSRPTRGGPASSRLHDLRRPRSA